jgi:hypothetical protein
MVYGKWEPARYVLGCGETIWVARELRRVGVEETTSAILVGTCEFVSLHMDSEPTALGKRPVKERSS